MLKMEYSGDDLFAFILHDVGVHLEYQPLLVSGPVHGSLVVRELL